MPETALITISDVSVYRKIDPKYNPDKFAAFVNEAQRKNLRGLLGDALYFDMFAHAEDAKYTKLINGDAYTYGNTTIQYYGIIPALVYWWLAIAAREGDLFHTGYGAVQFSNNPQQSFETSKEKERIAAGYMETAQNYANDVVKYLNTNRVDFPFWVGDSEKRSTEFVMFKL